MNDEDKDQVLVIQVNGKICGRVMVSPSATDEEKIDAAMYCEDVRRSLTGRELETVKVSEGGKLLTIVENPTIPDFEETQEAIIQDIVDDLVELGEYNEWWDVLSLIEKHPLLKAYRLAEKEEGKVRAAVEMQPLTLLVLDELIRSGRHKLIRGHHEHND